MAVKEIEEQLALEEDEGKLSVLSAELAARQETLDSLMGKFEKLVSHLSLRMRMHMRMHIPCKQGGGVSSSHRSQSRMP